MNFAGERHRESVLQNIAVNLDGWTAQTKQETAIYHTLNKLSVDTSRKVCSSAKVATLTDSAQFCSSAWVIAFLRCMLTLLLSSRRVSHLFVHF